MINWIKYDPANPPSKGSYLVSDGVEVTFAGWSDGSFHEFIELDRIIERDITHYAHINLPGEETDNA